MKLLLATHAFMWWDSDPDKLSPAALSAIRDPANEVWASVVNVREMATKSQLDELTLPSKADHPEAGGGPQRAPSRTLAGHQGGRHARRRRKFSAG